MSRGSAEKLRGREFHGLLSSPARKLLSSSVAVLALTFGGASRPAAPSQYA